MQNTNQGKYCEKGKPAWDVDGGGENEKVDPRKYNTKRDDEMTRTVIGFRV